MNMKQIAYISVWFFAALLAGCASLVSNESDVIQKSEHDDRVYQYFTLGNGLKVVTVTDLATTKSAVSLDVHVGSTSEKAPFYGLAHFLEHMLFLGTEKYPEAGEYQSFLTKHGGSHNAYTAPENTNYFFDIENPFFEGALDRFSQFFVAPLLTEKYVDQERHAVNSEYSSKFKNDYRRSLAVFKTVVNPEHPYSQFAVGSLETLKDTQNMTIRQAVSDFYQSHYSSNIMTLAIYSNQPPEVLKAMAQTYFSDIKNKKAMPAAYTVPFVDKNKLPLQVNIEPVKDNKILTLQFFTPSVTALYHSKPLDLISHVLGHEGEGSLLSYLKTAGLAESLSASYSGVVNDIEMPTVSIALTEKGLAQVDHVIAQVFRTIDLLKDQGIPKWLFDEEQKLSELAFQFSEKQAPIHYVVGLSTTMHVYPPAELLTGPGLLTAYTPDEIKTLLSHFDPRQTLVTLSYKGIEASEIEPTYEVPYQVMPITSDRMAVWLTDLKDQSIAMPLPNVFVPSDVALLTTPTFPYEQPKRIFYDSGITIWYKKDTTFNAPKSTFYITLRSQVVGRSVETQLMNELYVLMVNEQLNEFAYPALVAGLGYSIYTHSRGITVKLDGYTDKQSLLLQNIVDALKYTQWEQATFDRLKHQLTRGFENQMQNPPYQRVMDEFRSIMLDPAWSVAEKIVAIEKISMAQTEAYVDQFYEHVEIVNLAVGNLEEDDAKRMAKIAVIKLKTNTMIPMVEALGVIKLKPGERVYAELDNKHQDASIVHYIQGPNDGFTQQAVSALAAQVISSPFYHELRTEKQLGYIVFASDGSMVGMPGLIFIVQSNVMGSRQLVSEVMNFQAKITDIVNQLDDASFEQFKQGVIAQLMEPSQTVSQLSDEYWNEIELENASFDTKKQIALHVAKLSKTDFLSTLEKWFARGTTKQLVILAQGSSFSGSSSKKMTKFDELVDVKAFKKHHSKSR